MASTGGSGGVCVSSVSTGTGCRPCTSTMVHSHSMGQPRCDRSLTLDPSLRRSLSERISWNEVGSGTIMPMNSVASTELPGTHGVCEAK
jgi:hypothetical protein